MTHPTTDALLDAIVPHVAFDGWGAVAFEAACNDLGITADAAMVLAPRGALDLAIAFHKRGDSAMLAALAQADLTDMRFRDKVATAVRLRIAAVDDKEVVRRGSTYFAMPHMAAEGSKLIWGTADAIWNALGDTSQDVNWYSKRATLSAVYAAVVLFWLGDDGAETDGFIDRRIDNVMQFEKLKAQINKAPLLKPFLGPLHAVLGQIKAPDAAQDTHFSDDLPGQWRATR